MHRSSSHATAPALLPRRKHVAPLQPAAASTQPAAAAAPPPARQPAPPVQPQLGCRLHVLGAHAGGHQPAVGGVGAGRHGAGQRRRRVAAGCHLGLHACRLQVDREAQVVLQHHGQHVAHRGAQHRPQHACVHLGGGLGHQRLRAARGGREASKRGARWRWRPQQVRARAAAAHAWRTLCAAQQAATPAPGQPRTWKVASVYCLYCALEYTLPTPSLVHSDGSPAHPGVAAEQSRPPRRARRSPAAPPVRGTLTDKLLSCAQVHARWGIVPLHHICRNVVRGPAGCGLLRRRKAGRRQQHQGGAPPGERALSPHPGRLCALSVRSSTWGPIPLRKQHRDARTGCRQGLQDKAGGD